jgi:hypothetical protein
MVHVSTLVLEDLLKCALAQDMLMGTDQISGPINFHDEVRCVTALQLKLRYTAPDDMDSSINQYSETNVMHFLFSLLRITGLYMFRALLAHP